ncbi:uncharacterized protein LOC144146206 [Haemaphysalis longicornis]
MMIPTKPPASSHIAQSTPYNEAEQRESQPSAPPAAEAAPDEDAGVTQPSPHDPGSRVPATKGSGKPRRLLGRQRELDLSRMCRQWSSNHHRSLFRRAVRHKDLWPKGTLAGAECDVCSADDSKSPGQQCGTLPEVHQQGHALPERLNVVCSMTTTYKGPYPVSLCNVIVIKDAVEFDQTRVMFTVRSYDAFLSLKALQYGHSFKIAGLLTWRNIEQFRLQEPSSDALVDKVRRLLLRINFDGLCVDLAGVTRGNIMAYRHILREMRVNLMDEKLLCSLFDYNVLYKASFHELLSLLRIFNTTVIYRSVPSISRMETSVPNPFRHLSKKKYSLDAALEFAMEVRGPSHHRSVCWTLTPWGMEYRLLLPTEATGVGVLARFVRSAVPGSDLCSVYKNTPRSYDNLTASWYLVNDTKWVAYDDYQSLRIKVPQLLAAFAPDCVYVDDVQRDDPLGVCGERPFPLVAAVRDIFTEVLRHTTRHIETPTPNLRLTGPMLV